MLFAARVVDGFTGGNLSIAQAYITDVTDAKDRSKGLGIIDVALGLGFIIGPVTGGLLSQFGYAVTAPCKFHFRSNAYETDLTGILTHELAFSFFRRTGIRTYGFLNFNDNAGNTGRLTLDRENRIVLNLHDNPMDPKPT